MANRAAWGMPPNEVVAPPADEYAYDEWRKADTLRAPYKVSSALLRGMRADALESLVECPLLVFVNARSGGRQGAQLALRLSQAVGRVQVFDIGDKDYRPDKVLSKFYDNLKNLEAAGDPRATAVRQRLRLLVCGGDGTIAWVMGVVKKLRLQPEPPIAIMPLGTGNDLSRSFLWGPAFSMKWIRNHKSMYDTLYRIAAATPDTLDCWNITITTPRRGMFSNGAPHCLAPPVPTLAPPAFTPSLPTPYAVRSAAQTVVGSGYGRGQSSGLSPQAPGGGVATAAATLGLQAAGRDPSTAGATDRSVPASVAATHGSATPLHNIATSSVGSAATTFTTATNMSMHTAAAQAGTSVPPTIVSGAMSTSAEEEAGIGVLGGMFWNYFSVGLDAKAAWGFHSLREERPGCTSSRTANQFWYSFFSCTSGWFCCAQPLNVKVTLEVLQPGPEGEAAGWQPVKLPPNVKALVVVNLQSYAGGRNLWGAHTTAADQTKRGFKPPSYNDGLLEVVGLQSGWHTALVMANKGEVLHARRICQAAGVRLALAAPYVRSDGEPSHCYMQIDGEPWKQDIPVRGHEAPVRVEIVHGGVSRLLRNEQRPQSNSKTGSKTPSKLSAPRGPMGPLISAIAEPTTSLGPGPVPLALSPSPSSIQLSAPQTSVVPGSIGSIAGAPANVQTASNSGALQTQMTHGSLSGGAPAAWTRIGSAGRPSTASVAGSSSAAGLEPLVVETPVAGGGGGGGVRGSGGTAAGKQGEGAPEVSPPATAMATPHDPQPPVNDAAPTPSTLSVDLGSPGARSVATTHE